MQLSDHHSQYVDICQWNPKQDIFATASTDKNCYLWNTKDYHNGNPKSVQVSPIENSQETVSCLAWSPNGKFLILGLFILPVSCLGSEICDCWMEVRLEIWNSSTQSWEMAILRRQDWSIFARFLAFSPKASKNTSILLSKLQLLKIGLMNFRFLKACGSGTLVGTF